jgi:hypothetical protein
MHTTSTRPPTRGPARQPQTIARRHVLLLAVVGGLLLGGQAAEPRPALQTTLSAGVSERFDSNLMLQNDGPLARLHSWVTSVQPVAGLEWSPPGAAPLKLGVQYAPDFTFFHERDEESYLRHVGLLRLSLKDGPWAASAQVRAQFTDGSTEGPVWSTPDHPGSPPALGGPEVRYRRRNFFWQSPLEARYDLPGAYLRGVFEARLWDIMTDFKVLPGAFYQNYMDRTDVNGGVDLGGKPGRGWETAVGYRFGHQDQERLPAGLPYTYQNDYHRVLGVFNASPARWLKFGGELGPSFHQFNPASLPPGARDTETLLYFQANATLTLSSNTTFKAAAYQHLLPSTAGRANFQNIRATGTLEHRFHPAVRGSFRFDLQEYDFVRGLALRDEVFTAETRLEYALNRHLTLAAWYAHEWAQALHTGTSGREYDRHVAGLSVTVKP